MTLNFLKSLWSKIKPVKMTGVFIILTLLSSHSSAQQCRDIFSKRDLPLGKMVQSTKRHIAVPLYSSVTVNNISSIFKHNYHRNDQSKFGCKAVVTNIPGQGLNVYFFPTGSGRENWDIHHVSAVSVALNDPSGQLFYLRLPYIQGYQLTAKKENGQWRITALDISSTLTSLQETNSARAPNREQESAMLHALVSSIDDELRYFPLPDLPTRRAP